MGIEAPGGSARRRIAVVSYHMQSPLTSVDPYRFKMTHSGRALCKRCQVVNRKWSPLDTRRRKLEGKPVCASMAGRRIWSRDGAATRRVSRNI